MPSSSRPRRKRRVGVTGSTVGLQGRQCKNMKTIPVHPLASTASTNGHQPIGLITVEPGESQYQEPLVISVHGRPGSGKSRLIGSAVGDIGAIPMESKSRQSILAEA